MGIKPLRFRKAPTVLFGVSSLLFMGAPIHALTMPHANRPAQTEDASAREIAEFNRFLQSNQQVSAELHSKPWLVDNYDYLQSHPDLKSYLNDHPGLKDEISQNPVAFMQEDAQRSELAQFSRFLDTHREIADQLRNNPTDADNYNFLQSHPELHTYLQNHPAVQQALHDNANTFMKEEEGFSRNSGGRENAGGPGPGPGVNPGGPDRRGPEPGQADRDDRYRRQLADFNRFLDDHREIAEQVRKDPKLADDREFVQNHPPLAAFLRDNPGVRDDLRQDPNAFMHQEDRMAENRGYGDPRHDHMADFGGFLGDHRDIARDLDRDPNSVRDRQYVQNRPDLDKYLSSHPEVRSDLMDNPHDFVKGAQQMSNGEHTTGAGASGSGNGSGTSSTTTGTTGSKTTGGTGDNSAPAPKTKQ